MFLWLAALLLKPQQEFYSCDLTAPQVGDYSFLWGTIVIPGAKAELVVHFSFAHLILFRL
jgi:hypothetical protein